MIAPSTPPDFDHQTNRGPNAPDNAIDPDAHPYEPVRPDEGPRQQAVKLTPPPSRLMLMGGAVGAACVGGAVGYWLGKRRAPARTAPLNSFASSLNAAVELAPVAMQLLGNPLVRTLAIRMLMRQISQRVEH
jgi:hypothetical protein